MLVIAFFLMMIGVVAAAYAVWIYLSYKQTPGADVMAHLPDLGVALGLMLFGLVCAVAGKALYRHAMAGRQAQAPHASPPPADPPTAGSRHVANAQLPPGIFAHPVRLRLGQPNGSDTQSWLGGTPEMDAHLNWPETDAGPMSFIAQIHCAALPGDLWGGLGPREGWLVVFCDRVTDPGVRILHTKTRDRRLATPTKRPEGHLELAPSLLPDPPMSAPRVPLDVAPLDLPLEELFDYERRDAVAQAVGDQITALSQETTPDDPRFRPFNTDTARHLVTVIAHGLDFVARRSPNGTEAERDRVAVLERDAARFATDFADVLGQTDGAPLTESERTALRERIGAFQPESDRPLFGPKGLGWRYFDGFHWLARQAHFADPDSLPAAVRAAFQPIWREMAAAEPVVMGGQGTDLTRMSLAASYPDLPPKRAVCVLILSASPLMGWNFGDMSDWAIYIAPEDLEAGRWDRIVSVNTHGM